MPSHRPLDQITIIARTTSDPAHVKSSPGDHRIYAYQTVRFARPNTSQMGRPETAPRESFSASMPLQYKTFQSHNGYSKTEKKSVKTRKNALSSAQFTHADVISHSPDVRASVCRPDCHNPQCLAQLTC